MAATGGSPRCAPQRSTSSWPMTARCSCPCLMSRTWPEISSPDFPGERLVACRNPVLAAERARKRADLLAATEKLLAPLIARVAAGRLRGADAIGLAAGKVISTYKTAYPARGRPCSARLLGLSQARNTDLDGAPPAWRA